MHYSKKAPFLARLIERERLDKPGSTKPVFHLALDVTDSGIVYTPGDSIGVLPAHSAGRVELLLSLIPLPPTTLLYLERKDLTVTLREALTCHLNLNKVSKKTLSALSLCCKNKEDQQELETLSLDDKRCLSVDALLAHFPLDKDKVSTFLNVLPPLLPRFYSIASSQCHRPGIIDLLIAPVIYETQGQLLQGIASDFLCDQAQLHHTPIPIFVLPNAHFSLPQDPKTPLIMIGPGTGVAPFRAFLQVRAKHEGAGSHFLFFGERHKAYNFTYQDYMHELEKQGTLNLFTAFSRDQKEKRYVHHLMLEEAQALFTHIHHHKAHIYVCGDAKSMAKDVKSTITQIIEKEGFMSEEAAKAYFKSLIKDKRLLLDVY